MDDGELLDVKPGHFRAKGFKEETVFFRWIKMRNYTYRETAKLIGASMRAVKYWAAGQMLPGLVHAFKIEQVSKGKVPVTSWLTTTMARTQWRKLNDA